MFLLTNLARKVSKYAPTGSVAAIPTILAYLGRGKLAAAGLAGAGFLGKYLGEALTRDQIGKLEDLIAAESPLGGLLVSGYRNNRAIRFPAAFRQRRRSRACVGSGRREFVSGRCR